MALADDKAALEARKAALEAQLDAIDDEKVAYDTAERLMTSGTTEHSQVVIDSNRLDRRHEKLTARIAALTAAITRIDDEISSPDPDTTGPVVSAFDAEETTVGARLSWDSDELATYEIAYGTSAAPTNYQQISATLAIDHEFFITNMPDDTTVYVRLRGTDALGNITTDSSDRTFTTLAVSAPPSGTMGRSGVRAVMGFAVLAGAARDQVGDLAALESLMGRTVAGGDPIRVVGGNYGHFDGVPPENAAWLSRTAEIGTKWATRQDGSYPITYYSIMQPWATGVKTPDRATRVTHWTNLRDGDYDANIEAGIDNLENDGFGPSNFVPRIHEFDLTPGRPSSGLSLVNPSQVGDHAHVLAMETLYRQGLEHWCSIWKNRGYRLAYAANGGIFNLLTNNTQLGPGCTTGNSLDGIPYNQMLAYQFGIPDPSLYDIFGADLYWGGGAMREFSTWFNRVKLVQSTALALGKKWGLFEWSIYKDKNGTASGITDAVANSSMAQFFDWVETNPASPAAGSCEALILFTIANDGNSDVQNEYPQTFQAHWVNRLGNPALSTF